MNQQLSQLLQECLEKGSKEDLETLTYAIEGIHQKVIGKKRTYLEGLAHMERKLDQKSCEISIPLHSLFENSLGILHGGITATILDTAMGVLANYLLPNGFSSVTNQLNIHYIAPGVGDFLRCRAELIHQGKNTLIISGEAYRSDGKRIAHATGTLFIIKNKESGGK
ncbi:MAG: PaaI family thioesterase [Bacillota bacterium]|nr:PaaI family thioesterase [Bacillota bacterium]